jgi:aminoglycoside 6'-N-acetyltransferase I
MRVRPVNESDTTEWARLRQLLWPSPAGEHAREAAVFFRGPRSNPAEVFLAVDETDHIVGFAEVSIHREAAGCQLGHVGFLEGWFVEEPFRRAGIGTALVGAAEAWSRAHGCSEFASDTETHNEVSIRAHRALGFEEVERVVCFRKSLTLRQQ